MISSHYFYFLKHNLQSRICNRKRPLLAGFKITHRCNLTCRACHFWRLEDTSISYCDAIRIIDSFYEHGVRLLIFEGGEPFLWQDQKVRNKFEDLVEYARKKYFCVGITTNGLLPIQTKADVVWVSIDGLKDTHNANRGKSFEKIMTNIRSSSHHKIMANITINRLNYQEIPELIPFLTSIVRGITIQFYYPFPNSEDLSLNSEQRIQALNWLISLKKEGYPLMNSFTTLEDLKQNTWTCHPWLIASADPDGSTIFGCYLKSRAEISCRACGFAAHTEISKAYDWNFAAILTGRDIFNFKLIDVKK